MFFHGHLIIGYVQEPERDRYIFQLSGGDECAVSRDEFLNHWHEYRRYEDQRASTHVEHYRPLPVTLEIRRRVQLFPVDATERKKRQYS